MQKFEWEKLALKDTWVSGQRNILYMTLKIFYYIDGYNRLVEETKICWICSIVTEFYPAICKQEKLHPQGSSSP